MPIVINRDKCTGCETCIGSCPFEAIVMKDGKAYVNEYCQMCMNCLSACPEGAITEIKEEPSGAAIDTSAYKGVWVFAEVRGGKTAPVALELLGAGAKLAGELGVELSAVLFGASRAEAEELIKWGADKVYHCGDPIFEKFNDEPYSALLSVLVAEHKPEIVLAGATPIGRSFIPRVAARLRTGLTADCTSLEIEKETGNLIQIRPAFGGNIMAAIVCPSRRPQIATVRPRVMKASVYDPAGKGTIIDVKADNLSLRTNVVETVREQSSSSVNLQEADVIVAGGRGMGEKGFSMLYELAEVFGGVVGGSRAAVDEGWIPYSRQVGQTGKTVCPRIYIACGISGAVQHLVGMQSSDIVIAINKNPDAPIFGVADYGIVGDVHEVVPALIRKLREAKGS